MLKIQANMKGYMGKPATVLGAMDEETGILVIVKSVAAIPRFEDSFLIAADQHGDRDSLFSDGDLASAIGGYFKLKGSVAEDGVTACLRFRELAATADPAAVIEHDGVDVGGPKYRIAPDASNAHIATLAICAYAARQCAIGDTLDMADSITDLMAMMDGRVVTIGAVD